MIYKCYECQSKISVTHITGQRSFCCLIVLLFFLLLLKSALKHSVTFIAFGTRSECCRIVNIFCWILQFAVHVTFFIFYFFFFSFFLSVQETKHEHNQMLPECFGLNNLSVFKFIHIVVSTNFFFTHLGFFKFFNTALLSTCENTLYLRDSYIPIYLPILLYDASNLALCVFALILSYCVWEEKYCRCYRIINTLCWNHHLHISLFIFYYFFFFFSFVRLFLRFQMTQNRDNQVI